MRSLCCMWMGEVARKQCTRGSLASFTASQAISRSLQHEPGQLLFNWAMGAGLQKEQPCSRVLAVPKTQLDCGESALERCAREATNNWHVASCVHIVANFQGYGTHSLKVSR